MKKYFIAVDFKTPVQRHATGSDFRFFRAVVAQNTSLDKTYQEVWHCDFQTRQEAQDYITIQKRLDEADDAVDWLIWRERYDIAIHAVRKMAKKKAPVVTGASAWSTLLKTMQVWEEDSTLNVIRRSV